MVLETRQWLPKGVSERRLPVVYRCGVHGRFWIDAHGDFQQSLH
jgi:hypothetical protein